MNVIERIRKRFAIKRYRRKLGPLLRQRYGASETYTKGQIQTAVQQGHMSERYIQYAFAMYLSHAAYDALYVELGEGLDYDAMRAELSGGAGSFDTSGVADGGYHGGVDSDIGGLGNVGGDGGF